MLSSPGVLLIYKRMNMKGKVSSISLRNAGVDEDPVDPRQFKIVTPTGARRFRQGGLGRVLSLCLIGFA